MNITADSPPQRPDEVVDTALDVIRDLLGVDTIGPDDDAIDHGATSLVVVRILTEAGKRIGRPVNPRSLGGVVSARRIAEAAAGPTGPTSH